MTTPQAQALADALNLLAGIIEANKDRIGYMSGSAIDKYVKKARTLTAQAAAPAQAVVDSMAQERKAPGAPVLPADDRLTVAAIAMASGTKMLPLMQAIEAAGEGNVTANQKLTVDQALQAIAAALSKQVPAGDEVPQLALVRRIVDRLPDSPMSLIDNLREALGMPEWDHDKRRTLSQSGQADSTGGKA